MYNFQYIDHSKPPFIDISLPSAIIIPSLHLVALYTFVLAVDFYLLRNERHFNSVNSTTRLRIGMAVIHALLPMVFISRHPPFNILFAAVPWFCFSYAVHIPTDQLTVEKYVYTLFKVTIKDDDNISKTRIRCKGVAKFSLGTFKFTFMRLFINPLLPHHTEYALDYAWCHPMSLIYTVLFGIKAYCMLGFVDVVMGIEQALFAWNMVDLFNSPIVASSPRDFWSRRWNKIVRNMLHTQVFTANMKKKEKERNDDDIDDSINITTLTKPKAEESPAKNSIKNRSIKKTKNHATAKRVTRSSVAAAAAAGAIASPITTDDDDTIHTTAPTDEEGEVIAANTKDYEINDHDVIVTQEKQQLDEMKHSDNSSRTQKKKTFWSTRPGHGLLSFIVSATFHELIIMSACRKITLENFAFFTLQGIACMIEVELRQGALKQEPRGKTRVLCIALQLLFMSITGRLFTGPFLRYHFFQED